MDIILVLIGIVIGAWLWNDTLLAREQMLKRCRRACREMDVQLLDETVAVRGLALARNRSGTLSIRRSYGFEFSTDGADRWHGRAVLLGRVVESLQMENPDGVTIFGRGSSSARRKIESHTERRNCTP